MQKLLRSIFFKWWEKWEKSHIFQNSNIFLRLTKVHQHQFYTPSRPFLSDLRDFQKFFKKLKKWKKKRKWEQGDIFSNFWHFSKIKKTAPKSSLDTFQTVSLYFFDRWSKPIRESWYTESASHHPWTKL